MERITLVNDALIVNLPNILEQAAPCSGLIRAGAGIGVVFGSLITATARNPQMKNQFMQYAILGFALYEATGFSTLMVCFLILYL